MIMLSLFWMIKIMQMINSLQNNYIHITIPSISETVNHVLNINEREMLLFTKQQGIYYYSYNESSLLPVIWQNDIIIPINQSTVALWNNQTKELIIALGTNHLTIINSNGKIIMEYINQKHSFDTSFQGFVNEIGLSQYIIGYKSSVGIYFELLMRSSHKNTLLDQSQSLYIDGDVKIGVDCAINRNHNHLICIYPISKNKFDAVTLTFTLKLIDHKTYYIGNLSMIDFKLINIKDNDALIFILDSNNIQVSQLFYDYQINTLNNNSLEWINVSSIEKTLYKSFDVIQLTNLVLLYVLTDDTKIYYSKLLIHDLSNTNYHPFIIIKHSSINSISLSLFISNKIGMIVYDTLTHTNTLYMIDYDATCDNDTNCLKVCPFNQYHYYKNNRFYCTECDDNQYLYNNSITHIIECVDICPIEAKYNHNNNCIPICPQLANISFNKCVNECTYPFYEYNNTCIEHCPNNTYKNTEYKNNTIYQTCKPFDDKKSRNNKINLRVLMEEPQSSFCGKSSYTFINKTNNETKCLDNCPGSHPYHNTITNTTNNITYCVDICPSKHYTKNDNGIIRCVSNCSSTNLLSWKKDTQTICVSKCPYSYYDYNNTCTQKCPVDYYIDFESQKCNFNCKGKIIDHTYTYCKSNCEAFEYYNKDDNKCYNKCPNIHDNINYSNKRCVNECINLSFHDQTTHFCVKECPINTVYVQSISSCVNNNTNVSTFRSCDEICSSPELYSRIIEPCPGSISNTCNEKCIECVKSCNQNEYTDLKNKKCSIECPKETIIILFNKTCITSDECINDTNEQRYIYNDLCVSDCALYHQYENKKESKCVEDCDDLFHVKNKTSFICHDECLHNSSIKLDEDNTRSKFCWDRCPDGFFHDIKNKTCVKDCSSIDTTNISDYDTKECVTECVKDCNNNQYTYDNENNIKMFSSSCRDFENDKAKELYGKRIDNILTCVTNCQTSNNEETFVFHDYLNRKCVVKCKSNEFIYHSKIYNAYYCLNKCDLVTLIDSSSKKVLNDLSSKKCVSSCKEREKFEFNGFCKDYCFPWKENDENKCVENCPDKKYYLPEANKCLSQCPPGMFFIKTSTENECVYQCPNDYPMYEHEVKECLKNCDEKYLINKYSNECSTICPESFYGLTDKTNETKIIECVIECPENMYYKENRCVEECAPDEIINENNVCVKECPDNYYNGTEKNKNKCLKQCPILHYSKKCISDCPEKTLQYLNTCVNSCHPIENDEICKTCPNNTFYNGTLCLDECPLKKVFNVTKTETKTECVQVCDKKDFYIENNHTCYSICPENYKETTNKDLEIETDYCKKETIKTDCKDKKEFNEKYNNDYTSSGTDMSSIPKLEISAIENITPNKKTRNILEKTNNNLRQLELDCSDVYNKCLLVTKYKGMEKLCVSSCEPNQFIIDNKKCEDKCDAVKKVDKITRKCVNSCDNNKYEYYDLTENISNLVCIDNCDSLYELKLDDSIGEFDETNFNKTYNKLSCHSDCSGEYYGNINSENKGECLKICPSDTYKMKYDKEITIIVYENEISYAKAMTIKVNLCVKNCSDYNQFFDKSQNQCVKECKSLSYHTTLTNKNVINANYIINKTCEDNCSYFKNEDNENHLECTDDCDETLYKIVDNEKKYCTESCSHLQGEHNYSFIHKDEKKCYKKCPYYTVEYNELKYCEKVLTAFNHRKLYIDNNNNFMEYIATVFNKSIFFDEDNVTIEFINTRLPYEQKDKISFMNYSHCEEVLRLQYGISNDESLLIMKTDKIDEYKYTRTIEYSIFRLYDNKTVELDLAYCDDAPIIIDIPLVNPESEAFNRPRQFDLKGIDIHDQKDDFFSNICNIFPSPEGYDITLDKRLELYYDNKTLCQHGCQYKKSNYPQNLIKCTCIPSEQMKSSIISEVLIEKSGSVLQDTFNNLSEDLLRVLTSSNFVLVTCYKSAFDWNIMKNNYAFYVSISLFVLDIGLLFFFISYFIHDIKNYLKDQYPFITITQAPKSNSLNEEQGIIENTPVQESQIKSHNSRLHLKQIISTPRENPTFVLNPNPPPIELKQNNGNNGNNNKTTVSNMTTVAQSPNPLSKFNTFATMNNQFKSPFVLQPVIQYIYSNDELDQLALKEAIAKDNRTLFILYYGLIIKLHPILYTFRFNPKRVRFLQYIHFILNLMIDFVFTALFYSGSYITKMNDNGGVVNYFTNLPISIFAYLTGGLLNIFLNMLIMSEASINRAKNQPTNEDKELYIYKFLKSLQIRLIIYCILHIILFLFFSYMIIAFCSVFANSQYPWLITSFITILLTMTMPFFIALIFAGIRGIALSFNNELFYKISAIITYVL